jgi:hypothetical protein
MSLRVLSILAAVIAISLFASACGSSGASQDEVEQARKEGSAETRQKLKIERIEEELHSLKKHGHATNQNPGQTEGGTSGTTAGGTTSCGGTLSVGPNTTCGFAANVEADYYSEIGSGAGTVYSYSPTRERYYSMYCTAGSPHQCTGGSEASVYFP